MKHMTRRDFLAGLAAASAVCLAGCGKASSAIRSGRVIVIGAGASGLAAARSLADSGFRVTVFEARDRIAGRIWTDSSLGAPLDMGASWIHGIKGNPLASFCGARSIPTMESDFESRTLFDHDGSRIRDEDVEPWEDIIDEAERLAGQADEDISVARAVQMVLGSRRLSPRESRILENIFTGIECEFGGSVDRLSMRYLNEDEGFSGADVVFPKGYAAVPHALADGLDIRLSEPVRVVTSRRGGVVIETDRGRHEADAAVVTLPLGILKRGGVEFKPALPEDKQASIQRLGIGVLNKVAVRFPDVFWPRETEFFEFLSGQISYGAVTHQACGSCHELPRPRETSGFAEFVNMVPVNGAPVLVALTGGAFGHRLDSWPEERIKAEVMRTITGMFGSSVSAPTGLLVSRWHSDPWAGGAYSHVPVGATMDDFKTLARRAHGSLYFAGEATSELYPSTVHGAFLSGQRAAKEIKTRLG